MNNIREFLDTVSEAGKYRIILGSLSRNIKESGDGIVEEFRTLLSEANGPEDIEQIRNKMIAAISALNQVKGERFANIVLGRLISWLIEIERDYSGNTKIMTRLLGDSLSRKASMDAWNILVINPGSTSTKVAWFRGIYKMDESEVHLDVDTPDSVDNRAAQIVDWLNTRGVSPSDLRGIACRGGFMHPVPSGTYKICGEMIHDLENPRINHASNMAVFIGMKIAADAGPEHDILITISDPVVTDEIELVERITGLSKIRLDGTGAHYLNHRAVQAILSSVTGVQPQLLSSITAHVGGGTSIALHRGGAVTSVVDAFSGVPSANRCGKLDLPRLLDALKHDYITTKELESAVFKTGGLLSLAGTNDFRALEGFGVKGATSEQQQKIEVLFKFYARQITSSMFKLEADGREVEFSALSGGLARSEKMVAAIRNNINGRWPLVIIPGSVEHESLASGLIRGIYEPVSLKNYGVEKHLHAERRKAEDNLLDTQLFQRNIFYRKSGSMITSLDELIDDTLITVKDNYLPTVAIVGADNEEAILAAKRANEEGQFKIARFCLIGDYSAINKIAYEYDLVIDNKNYIIEDAEDSIARGIELLDEGKVDILMKGSFKTEEILRGVFKYLKSSGKLKSGQLISHSVVMDIPRRNKLLIISDAAVNTYPDLEKRVQILENTLKIAKILNVKKPKVAIISAIESVNKSIESSIEAKQIADRFADRDDCVVEGPLSFDVAMDSGCALEKKYAGEIKGTADILIMPDIDAGNVLYKTLTTQSGAVCAGIILCGDMPLILTSRGDSARSKLASIGLSVNAFFRLPK
ncbi:MAG: butyrate kinase [Deltaproteobacteria bacterium]|nr:butyrate kinase [Deltaproteobacteria bacterium]